MSTRKETINEVLEAVGVGGPRLVKFVELTIRAAHQQGYDEGYGDGENQGWQHGYEKVYNDGDDALQRLLVDSLYPRS